MNETAIANRKRRCSGDSNDENLKRSATEEKVALSISSSKDDNKEDAISAKDCLFTGPQAKSDLSVSTSDVSMCDAVSKKNPEAMLLPETNSVDDAIIESSGATESINKQPESVVEEIEEVTGFEKSADPAIDVGSGPEPENLFEISFYDVNTFTELKPVIEQAIRSAMLQLKRTISITTDNLRLIVAESNEFGSNDECCFIVDAMPTAESQTGEAIAVVPKYRLNVCKVFNNEQLESLNEEDACKRPRNTCWNCDGEHPMRDCPEPRNFNKVRQNRVKFSSGKTERYHVDATQRFGTFVPGEISNELRKALGLHRNELPLHIYRMRELGYPPGWLEHAKVSRSGLALFDANVGTYR